MKFSIIICAYNAVERLPKTLGSILAQSHGDYEVVTIDGGSKDGTQDVLRKYENKFSGRLRWISDPDKGIYNAMNKGVRMAGGEFLNIIGAGDWLEKDALKKIGDVLSINHETDAIYGKTRVWDSKRTSNYEKQTLPEALAKEPMQHPALFYRKSLHEKFGLYDEGYKISSDYAFCLKAFYEGGVKVKVVPEILCNFVTDGISSKRRFLALWENAKIKQKFGIRTNFFKEIFLSTRLAKILCRK